MTICLEFYVTLVKYFDLFSSIGDDGYQLATWLPTSLKSIEVAFKDTWYIIYEEIQPYAWNGYCLSYRFLDHRISIAFNGKIVFTKQDDKLLGKRKFTEKMFDDFMLGKKTSGTTFSGEIARFNAWKKSFDHKDL